ncbi:hypothetical protein CCHL11_08874 [Colletotrichum chlorophyti]|uniref:Uncharacterized protein n=1 Tax=Colletotrichum chlorophyti TaxID=708187 RepID=A0A1Q8S0H3_9PEZI|nr:hypothetical protein CCHL11_08874 [Colletotrichum chlorophyti]
MHRQPWQTRLPVELQAQPLSQPQDRETLASLKHSHNVRHNTIFPHYSKPSDVISVPSTASTVISVSRESNNDTGLDDISTTTTTTTTTTPTTTNVNNNNIDHGQDANDCTFTTPVLGPSAGMINPFDLSAAAPSEPRHVLIRVEGDAGAYLGNLTARPASQDVNLPSEMDGSRSVAGGDHIQTGWSLDYYGLSSTRLEYGNGLGWRSQENEGVTDAQGNFGWPRKYVCSMCSLRWNAMPLPAKVIRGDVSQKERIDLRIVRSVCSQAGTGGILTPLVPVNPPPGNGAAYKELQPNPPDARKDPGFSRPGCSEFHYYLDHEGPANAPCVRGLCQTCRPVSLLPDSQPTTHCCPPPVAEPGYLKEIYRCIMDNCPFLTDTRREMKAHLHSPRKNGHKSYLTGLASRIEHGQPLSAVDKEISSRLMLMFNDRDARGQKSISQPINTVLGPEDISSPAILREHTQWMSYLGLHTPEVHRRDFWDSRTGQWYYREYNLDNDFEDAIENARVVSYATGRPVKASEFLWR